MKRFTPSVTWRIALVLLGLVWGILLVVAYVGEFKTEAAQAQGLTMVVGVCFFWIIASLIAIRRTQRNGDGWKWILILIIPVVALLIIGRGATPDGSQERALLGLGIYLIASGGIVVSQLMLMYGRTRRR
jgi:uncharacterized membrane protein YhaH (DUF805 family)